MKTIALLVVVAGVLLTGTVAAEEARTLTGEFFWTQRDEQGDLKAVFTPSGEGTWDVSFHFNFRDKEHVYSGTAEGSLADGELTGEVKNEDKKRTFTFQGAFEDGTFRGTHAEVEGETALDTGTMTLTE